MSEMFNFSCLLLVKQYSSHLPHSIPSFDTYFPANQKRSYITRARNNGRSTINDRQEIVFDRRRSNVAVHLDRQEIYLTIL